MSKVLKRVLVCGILLGMTSTPVLANDSLTTIKSNAPTETIIKSQLKDKIEIEKQSRKDIGRKIYVNKPNTVVYNSVSDIKINNVSRTLELGNYLVIVNTALVNDTIYYEVSSDIKSKSIGWIVSNEDYSFVSKDIVTHKQQYDLNKEYFILNKETPFFTKIPENNLTKLTDNGNLAKDIKLSVLDSYEKVTDKDALNWYFVSRTFEFDSEEVAKEFTQDTPFKYEEKVATVQSDIKDAKTETETKEVKTYLVNVSGWVNQTELKETILNTLVEDTDSNKQGETKFSKESILLKEKPETHSNTVKTITNDINTWDISDIQTEIIPQTKQTWYKVQEIDSDGNLVKESSPKFISENNLTPVPYTQITKETKTAEKMIVLTSDITTLDKPEGSKQTKEVSKLTKGSYYYTTKEISAINGSLVSNWIEIVDENGKNLGLTKASQVTVDEKGNEVAETTEKTTSLEFPVGNRLEYVVQPNDTLESILEKFKITETEFEQMNIELIYSGEDEFKITTGQTVVVKAPKVVYDTTNVTGTKSGIALVQDIMYTAPVINQYKLKPSIAIAQALLESGGGTSGLATQSNNLFGIKGTYRGQGKSWSTQEDSGGGNMYTIQSSFRTYPNKMVSVLDYIDLLTENARYSKAVGAETPLETIQAIKDGGYATDSSYVSKVMDMVDRYDLTQFDTYK